MQVVILAGGLGSRLSEETHRVPKPMVEIGGSPILYHIMRIYAEHGLRDFVVASGYKNEVIKDYFSNFHLRHSDYTVNLRSGAREIWQTKAPDWRVSVVDTGLHTMTGGRLLRLRDTLKKGPFMVTYGDGLANIDITALIAFHKEHGRIATITAVRPPPRFGGLVLDGTRVKEFSEKQEHTRTWINGGFFIFEPEAMDYFIGDDVMLEREPMEALVRDNQLMAYQHQHFWQPMDTLRDKNRLEELWQQGKAPWKTWND